MTTPLRNKYLRNILPAGSGNYVYVDVDVYSVLDAFDVRCPARQHAIKKLLCAGLRDKGPESQDLLEAAQAVERAVELAQQRNSQGSGGVAAVTLPPAPPTNLSPAGSRALTALRNPATRDSGQDGTMFCTFRELQLAICNTHIDSRARIGAEDLTYTLWSYLNAQKPVPLPPLPPAVASITKAQLCTALESARASGYLGATADITHLADQLFLRAPRNG